jgi:hypothetical protein
MLQTAPATEPRSDLTRLQPIDGNRAQDLSTLGGHRHLRLVEPERVAVIADRPTGMSVLQMQASQPLNLNQSPHRWHWILSSSASWPAGATPALRAMAARFLSVAAIAASGCGSSSSSSSAAKSTRQRPAVYRMTINASLAGTHIRMSGTTDLPDGARVELFAGRAFRQLHGDVRMANVGGLGAFATAAVNSGHFSGTIPVVKHPLDPLGLLPEQGPVAVIDPVVTACATFLTGRQTLPNGSWYQPDPTVRSDVGSSGEQLRGSPHVHVFGSLTKYPSLYLEVSTHARVPTSGILQQIGSLQSQAPAVEPLAGFLLFLSGRSRSVTILVDRPA